MPQARHTDEGEATTVNVFVAITQRTVRVCFPDRDEVVLLEPGAALFFNTNVVHAGCANPEDSKILFFSFDVPSARAGGKG